MPVPPRSRSNRLIGLVLILQNVLLIIGAIPALAPATTCTVRSAVSIHGSTPTVYLNTNVAGAVWSKPRVTSYWFDINVSFGTMTNGAPFIDMLVGPPLMSLQLPPVCFCEPVSRLYGVIVQAILY